MEKQAKKNTQASKKKFFAQRAQINLDKIKYKVYFNIFLQRVKKLTPPRLFESDFIPNFTNILYY